MAQKKFPQIQENYPFYNKLLSERKLIFQQSLKLTNWETMRIL